jgi:hypothetical protein
MIKTTEKGNVEHYYCILTDILNKNLHSGTMKKHLKMGYTNGSYLCRQEKNRIAFRYPGATRGHIELYKDEFGIYRINNFIFYDCMLGEYERKNNLQPIYKKSVIKELNKYKHMEIDIPRTYLSIEDYFERED